MRFGLGLLLAAHALIHLMGFARAFEIAPLDQLRIPVLRLMS